MKERFTLAPDFKYFGSQSISPGAQQEHGGKDVWKRLTLPSLVRRKLRNENT